MALRPTSFKERLRHVPRRTWVLLGTAALIVGAFPFWGGALGTAVARSQLTGRLGVPVEIRRGVALPTKLVLKGVTVGPASAPLAVLGRVDVPFAALWGGGTVVISGARFEVERGGDADNLSPVLRRLTGRGARGKAEPGGGGGGGRRGPGLLLQEASVRARDHQHGIAVLIGALTVSARPGDRLTVDARQISGSLRVRGGDRDPKFGAGSLEIEAPLEGLRPVPAPDVRLGEAYVQLLPQFGLTGVRGTVKPRGPAAPGGGARPLAVDLSGSYGGARESLWTATGELKLPEGEALPELTMALRAARFSLERIKDILPPSVLEPAETMVDAALDLGFRGGKLGMKGRLEVTGLNLHHEAVASEPVMGMNLGLALDAALDLERRRLDLTLFEGRLRSLVGRLSGSVELAPGKFKFTDGSEMPMVPKIELTMKVPRIPCAKLVDSIPGPIIPHLQGFQLKGDFEANVGTKIDYANLEALELTGKVGIDGCRVLKAPDEVAELSGTESISQIVEIPSDDPKAPPGATELMAFAIGPENPNFAPFDKISPHLINSIMTTEDGGFFKHRGWVAPEFKTALRRNLAGGGFRLGASSITMQMVKNVLLSREKTLSRKLQELFLVWYVEQQLPKERILELYFNAIEFGPRLYGIGAATKHYFSKTPDQITPLEAAFFSSILPSPKRRFIQYCHGQLYPPWDKYVRRILARVHERGRLTDEEYAAASAETLTFDTLNRGMTEAECLAWVKKITERPTDTTEAPEATEN